MGPLGVHGPSPGTSQAEVLPHFIHVKWSLHAEGFTCITSLHSEP